MQQIANVWTALDTRRRLIVGAATVAVFAAVLGLARMAATPSMSLLYADLGAGQAGEVVSALDQRGVAYDIRGNSIFVEAARRDELRMTLAGEGLPANAARGYELLDGLSGFGTTSQMFNAAYWRAKEGELARTIVSHPAISTARVHIAKAGTNPFQRDVEPTASVSVGLAGSTISGAHARALKFLVASAVTGLSPENVSVIDGKGKLVGTAGDVPAKATEDRAEILRERVQRLLAARVGPGNAVVEVSVDTVTRSESVRETVIDPDSRVAISTDTEERTNSASGRSDDVTVASNLPDGEAGDGETSSSRTNETRERVNYEVSQTEREVTVAPGAIRRLSVAVLVNGVMGTDANGAPVFEPRDEQELDALRELVASAVGFDEERGDVITIKTMQFEQASPAGTAAVQDPLFGAGVDLMSLAQAVVLGIVALLLGLFVVRPLLTRSPDRTTPELVAPAAATEQSDREEALTGEIDTGEIDPGNMSLIPTGDMGAEDTDPPFNQIRPGEMPDFRPAQDDPVDRLRALIGERREETVEILRTWLEGEEENA
ncbi:flagellar basal-body MS-ring/collar protein FliF [Roseovarius salis]|uniref:flagellar basal-body MS-ring/collar protein FliF n=1 Tax=Roseovarius salis TaxID=3376063 RepID=UPI0037C6F21B